MIKRLPAVLAIFSLLSACGDSTPIQTVQWYKKHNTERQEMLAKCKNDRNAMDTAPNCVNAEQAQIEQENSRRGRIRPKVPTFD